MSIREQIKEAFNDFSVDGVSIPVALLQYKGHDEPYVTYMYTDSDNVLTADNRLVACVDYYDFDVYSKGNFEPICDRVIEVNESIGFSYQPSRSSEDMYETDTGYYHKTLSFAIERSFKNG